MEENNVTEPEVISEEETLEKAEEVSEDLPDWQSRCLAAEAALADSLAFADRKSVV